MTNTNMKYVQTILKLLKKKPERESLQHPVSLLPSFHPNLFHSLNYSPINYSPINS